MAKKKYDFEAALERQLGFWFSLGVEYLVFRYIFGVGHWAIVLAYVLASTGPILYRIDRAVR